MYAAGHSEVGGAGIPSFLNELHHHVVTLIIGAFRLGNGRQQAGLESGPPVDATTCYVFDDFLGRVKVPSGCPTVGTLDKEVADNRVAVVLGRQPERLILELLGERPEQGPVPGLKSDQPSLSHKSVCIGPAIVPPLRDLVGCEVQEPVGFLRIPLSRCRLCLRRECLGAEIGETPRFGYVSCPLSKAMRSAKVPSDELILGEQNRVVGLRTGRLRPSRDLNSPVSGSSGCGEVP